MMLNSLPTAAVHQMTLKYAAVRFAAAVVRQRGQVSNDQVQAVLNAGYSDAHVVDILLAVALNTFTNYVNEVTQTEVDFPSSTTRH